MCDTAVSQDPHSPQYVPDWFAMQEQVKIWHNDYDHCNDDEIIELYDAFKKRKAQKQK